MVMELFVKCFYQVQCYDFQPTFPVETNFLSAIVADAPEERAWEMPYPLYDIANFVDINIVRAEACGIPGLRQHHPLDDALASAVCFLKTMSDKK